MKHVRTQDPSVFLLYVVALNLGGVMEVFGDGFGKALVCWSSYLLLST